jgi:hypothetical protein
VIIDRLPDEVRAALGDESVPDWRAPMLATLTDKRFSDPRWLFERKFDGVRCLAFRAGDRVRLLSRNRRPLDTTYPELVDALATQDTSRFVVDGEVVAFEGRRTKLCAATGSARHYRSRRGTCSRHPRSPADTCRRCTPDGFAQSSSRRSRSRNGRGTASCATRATAVCAATRAQPM